MLILALFRLPSLPPTLTFCSPSLPTRSLSQADCSVAHVILMQLGRSRFYRDMPVNPIPGGGDDEHDGGYEPAMKALEALKATAEAAAAEAAEAAAEEAAAAAGGDGEGDGHEEEEDKDGDEEEEAGTADVAEKDEEEDGEDEEEEDAAGANGAAAGASDGAMWRTCISCTRTSSYRSSTQSNNHAKR